MQQHVRAAAAALGMALACSAWAWPDKPIKLIVAAPPGGTMDIVARVVGQQLSSDLGQPVVVENKPGAGAAIGIQAMLQAPPDGHTLAITASNALAEIPHVMKPPYDPLKDVLPIASLARSGVVLVTSAKVPATDFKSLLAYLQTRKGSGTYASYSPGTVSHYAGLILSDKAGLDFQHVGYQGSPPALQHVLGGQVDMMFDGMLTSVPLIKAGKLRAYGFSGAKRSQHLPDVPTMTELGYPEIQFVGWVGMIGSPKLKPELLAQIQKAVTKAASAPGVHQKLLDVGLEPEIQTDTAALKRDTREMSERNAAIVRKYEIKM
ncbi:Tripartite-type tricarboxylate transporter, receptor component TctC [Variovorax sp. YR216]|nr:tripartite tricarboxylate transporter substrate binding protein [Variovorax sp. YR216]SEB22402.1 Tripartite-type tricarboxylate transporter, receptor component TctC [Variovorax sp. YR216]